MLQILPLEDLHKLKCSSRKGQKWWHLPKALLVLVALVVRVVAMHSAGFDCALVAPLVVPLVVPLVMLVKLC
jgi:hypothetical protein